MVSAATFAEQLTFGMERELEYLGHITPALHLVPLARRTFVSADETHIRVWGPQGDIAKTTFPLNRRSMVCSMTYCPAFSLVLTAEVDMTVKAYSADHLDVLEIFSLEQARKQQGEKVSGRSSSKVTAIACMPQSQFVLLGGERGCEMWQLVKSAVRRQASAVRLEFHLNIKLIRQVCELNVLDIVVSPTEQQRVIIWGKERLIIFDMDLKQLASCPSPHGAEPTRCACVHEVSIIDTAMLTGGADGAVNYWSIQAKRADTDDVLAVDESSTVRLDHSFQGHIRPVEMVCFYHKLERNQRQRLAVSFARDGKLKVWSLETFSNVYTLDFSLLDARASVFPLAPHYLAVSSAQSTGDSQRQRATVALMRFSAHVATPYATTNHSPVVQIAQPPIPPDLGPSLDSLRGVPLQTCNGTVIVSEDMAIRVIDGFAGRLISTLPPPPHSKVQVLRAFICPMWQLLVLWLSTQEIAIFFIPQATAKKGSDMKEEVNSDSHGDAARRNKSSTTPLLIRRFSILEVTAEVLDKDLSKEVFMNVTLYNGTPLPAADTLVRAGFVTRDAVCAPFGAPNDWYLVVGSKLGTLQAFRIGQILADTPIWERLAVHLPPGAWSSERFPPSEPLRERSSRADSRLVQIEREHAEAMELARVPGQKPFPRGAMPLRLHGRWQGHNYPINIIESASDRLLTLDGKHILKIWKARDMSCTFQYQMSEYVCHTPYLRLEMLPQDPRPSRLRPANWATAEATSAEPASARSLFHRGSVARKAANRTPSPPDGRGGIPALVIAGLVVGTASGSLLLVAAQQRPGSSSPKAARSECAEVLQSLSTHGDAVLQVDHLYPLDVFVSAGKDNVVKIWSGNLALLREIAFPQHLTCVAFKRDLEMNPAKGHGDIMVGFAAHVEQVALSCWARGLERTLGTLVDETHGQEAAHEEEDDPFCFDGEGVATTDDIDQLARLFSERLGGGERPKALADVPPRAASASGGTASLGSPEPPADEDPGTEAGLLAVWTADFRGRAAVPIRELVGPPAADVQAGRRSPRDGGGERRQLLDPGDFRMITRAETGYYDWTVTPTTHIDAPRETAIRGIASPSNVAVVTSLGVGHLRGATTHEAPISPRAAAREPASPRAAGEGPASPKPLPPARPNSRSRRPPGRGKAATPAGRPAAASPAHGRPAAASPTASPPEESRPLKPMVAAKSAASVSDQRVAPPLLAGVPAHGSPLPEETFVDRSPTSCGMEDSPLEAWRTKRVGRGMAGINVPRPRQQSEADSSVNPIKALAQRGQLVEIGRVPEDADMLKKFNDKQKAAWRYCRPENLDQVMAHETSVRSDSSCSSRHSQTIWTTTGRMVCRATIPPKEGLPPCAFGLGLPLPYMKPRPPMTRSEFTEKRIIEAAARPPAQPPDLELRSSQFVAVVATAGLQSHWSRGDSSAMSNYRPRSGNQRDRLVGEQEVSVTLRMPLSAR